MYRNSKIDEMAADISANIENLESQLLEEYKRLIRILPEFDDIATEFVLLERKTLAQELKEYEATTIVDRLHEQLGTIFGPERDHIVVMEAAMAVMDEYSSAATSLRH